MQPGNPWQQPGIEQEDVRRGSRSDFSQDCRDDNLLKKGGSIALDLSWDPMYRESIHRGALVDQERKSFHKQQRSVLRENQQTVNNALTIGKILEKREFRASRSSERTLSCAMCNLIAILCLLSVCAIIIKVFLVRKPVLVNSRGYAVPVATETTRRENVTIYIKWRILNEENGSVD